jgi:hypothetical protein
VASRGDSLTMLLSPPAGGRTFRMLSAIAETVVALPRQNKPQAAGARKCPPPDQVTRSCARRR